MNFVLNASRNSVILKLAEPIQQKLTTQTSIRPLNQQLCNRRFDARFQTLIYMLFQTLICFIFSYFTTYLDVSYCNFRCSGEFFQMIAKSVLLKSLNWTSFFFKVISAKKMVAFQNVSSEAHVKNFFTS